MKNKDWTMIIIIIAVIALSIVTTACVHRANCMTANTATMASGAISATATVILGVIAVWQNKRYKALSDKRKKEIEKLTLTPECYLIEIETSKPSAITCKTMIPDKTNGRYYYFIFSSLNQPMLDVTIGEIRLFDNQRKCLSIYPNQEAPFLVNFQTFSIFENYTKFAFETLIPEEYNKQDISCETTLDYRNIYNTLIRKTITFDRSKDSISLTNIIPRQAELL